LRGRGAPAPLATLSSQVAHVGGGRHGVCTRVGSLLLTGGELELREHRCARAPNHGLMWLVRQEAREHAPVLKIVLGTSLPRMLLRKGRRQQRVHAHHAVGARLARALVPAQLLLLAARILLVWATRRQPLAAFGVGRHAHCQLTQLHITPPRHHVPLHAWQQRRIPAVLDGVRCSPRQELSDFDPPVPEARLCLDDRSVLVLCPRA